MTSSAKKSLTVVIALLATAAAGWFGHQMYARSMERRCLEEAQECLEKRDFLNAALCLRRVLDLNPKNIDAATRMAEMLEAQGKPGAVEWRKRAAEFHPHDASFRFDWAQTAIKAGDHGSADLALKGVEGPDRDTAQYHKLCAALYWSQGHSDEAEMHYSKALQLDPTNQTVAFNLATIRLRSTNSAVADAARFSMERMTNNPALKLTALHQLLIFENLRRSPTNALKYSTLIVQDPNASYADQLDHLELLHQVKSPEYESWLAGLKQGATNSSARAFGVGRWIAKVNGLDDLLAWIDTLPEEVRNDPPLAFLTADCHVLLKNWQKLVETAEAQNWGEADPNRMALIALAQRSLGQDAAFQTAWREALREADRRRDRLVELAQFAQKWGWNEQKDQVLERINAEFPKQKLAAVGDSSSDHL
jgi:Tfp pilus assembly protein PilF